MIKPDAMTDHQKKFLDEKRREFEAQHGESEAGAFPRKGRTLQQMQHQSHGVDGRLHDLFWIAGRVSVGDVVTNQA